MTRPTIQVRIAFVNAPFAAIASLTWIDISAYVWLDGNPGGSAITINRGRQFELDAMQAGTCTLVLDNRDRRFDPDNAASPYWPNVIPTRRINLRATWNAITYDLFTGYVESWEPFDPTPGAVAQSLVRLTAVDLFKALNYTTFTMNEMSDNNPVNVIQDVLNTSGWPAADRDPGSNSPTRIPAQLWPSQPALPAIQTIATADGGTFFIEDDGRTVYHDRYWSARNSANRAVFGDASAALGILNGPISAAATTIALISIATFPTAGTVLIDSELIRYTGLNAGPPQLIGCIRGESMTTASSHSGGVVVTQSELPYADVRFSFDDTRLINHAEVTRAGGALQSADDAASQATYGVRAKQVTNLLITTDAEALARAQYVIILYALPYARVASLLLNGELAPATLWPQILSRTFDDKIIIMRRPPGGGSTIAKIARISAMSQSIGANQWLTTWQVYRVGNDQFFILDSATNGILDTSRLAY